jgi:phage gp46-like protein
MLDIATRPSPSTGQAAIGLPFDWQLVPPTQAVDHPWHACAVSTGVPEHYVDVLAVYAISLEDTLHTAITLSLFTDRRARDDEALPYGALDRRGWVGAEFLGDVTDWWGSAFWLLYVSKSDIDILERARFAAQEALAWLVSTGVASRVEVEALWVADDRLAIRPRIFQGSLASPVYDVLWGTTIRRGGA